MMDLRALAHALGGDVVGGQVLAPGPDHSLADRSLAVRSSHQSPLGFIAHSHAGDDWKTCREYVAAKLGCTTSQSPPPPRRPIKSARPSADDGTARARRARQLWKEAMDPAGTIVERYLASRALALPADIAGRVVRFHSACPWRLEASTVIRVPAMLTAFRKIDGDELVAVQRTALTVDGIKIGRRMLGPVGGAAIKIADDIDVESGLILAEGFETALAGHLMGLRPIWATGSASAIGTFPVLGGIECLSLCAEFDNSGANARSIEQCGDRWTDTGREVVVVKPLIGGDLNDAVLGRAAA